MEEFIRFIAVADLGAVSRAADRLHLSQPALSRTIAILEQRFRTQLFHRHSGGVELTPMGRILYDHASRAIRALRDAEERIAHDQLGSALSLSICAGVTWGNAILPAVVGDFMAQNPDTRIRLEVLGGDLRMAGLADGNYDLSYGVNMPRFEGTPNLVFVPLLSAPYLVYAAACHPLRGQTLINSEKLRAYRWIKYKYEYDFDPAQWLKTERIYAATTNTLISTLELVRGSDLLLSTAESFVPLFARQGVFPLGPDPVVDAVVSGVHHLGYAALTPVAAQFLDFSRQRCAKWFGTVPQGVS